MYEFFFVFLNEEIIADNVLSSIAILPDLV